MTSIPPLFDVAVLEKVAIYAESDEDQNDE